MPAEVLRDPLTLKLSLPGETPSVIEIGDLPNPKLAADLAEGLAASVHPHGPLGKRTTIESFTCTLRRMVRELAEVGFTGSAAELTRAVLGAFWLRSHYLVEYRTRTILRALDTRHRVLTEPVRQMVFGTNYTRPPANRPLPPYEPAEWNRITDLCKSEVRRLRQVRQAMIVLAESGQDPAVGGWSEANAAWLLLRTGPVRSAVVAEHMGMTAKEFKPVPRHPPGPRRAVSLASAGGSLHAAADGVDRHRPGRSDRHGGLRHPLDRSDGDSPVLHQGPHRGREPGAVGTGLAVAGALAGARVAAARTRAG
ncbi:hypothetical protein GCM10009579_70550 [Streptomyces javensis]|uniref:Uncharacterized protein n=1 Tax=Streptomyces javensis TaxID=114698 RepID=A0ABN1X9L2_9ACTN